MDSKTRAAVVRALFGAAETLVSATTEKRLRHVFGDRGPKLDDWDRFMLLKVVFNALGLETRVGNNANWTKFSVDGRELSPAETLEVLSPELKKNSVIDGYVVWLATQFKNGEIDTGTLDEMMARFRAVCIWASENKVDMTRLTAEEALAQSKGYVSKVSQKAAQKEASDTANPVLYKFSDGWYVQELKTDEALKNEGDRMGHCVGGYCAIVKSGKTRVFSLRNPKGGSRVTMEYSQVNDAPFNGAWMFRQVFGRENSAPPEGTLPYLVEFINKKFDGEPNGLLLCGVDGAQINMKTKPVDFQEITTISYSDGDSPLGSLRNLDFSGAELSGHDLNGISFSDSNFDGAVLVDVNFNSARLDGCSFRNADLRGASFDKYTWLTGADFRGARLDKCDFLDVKTSNRRNAKFDDAEQLSEALLDQDNKEVAALLSSAEAAGDEATVDLCRRALVSYPKDYEARAAVWLLLGESPED